MSSQLAVLLSVVLTVSLVSGDSPTAGLYDDGQDEVVTKSESVRSPFMVPEEYFYPEMSAFLDDLDMDRGAVQQRSARFDNSFILKRELDNLLKQFEYGLNSPYESHERGEMDEASEQMDERGGVVPKNMKRFQVPSIIKRYNVPSIIKRYGVPSIIKRFNVPSIIKRFNVPSIIKKKLMIPAVIKKNFAYNPSIIKRFAATSGDNNKKNPGQIEDVKEDTEGYYSIE